MLIDTAGRYTTQDSDAGADAKSWEGFLDMLSENRPRQPINGVLVCISIEDLMTLNPGELDTHANAIRRRLDELHKKLKISFPVYVMVTKMDLVAGFMEFFGDLSPDQGDMVWGMTFQPKKQNDNMVTQFGAEFDELMRALTDQMTDRMQQVPDPRARSRIFAFPSQIASLKGTINDFLTKVFEPSRYRVDVALRGVYFTSGTQEGNPIDRILGSLSRNFGAQAAAAPVMSGQGAQLLRHRPVSRGRVQGSRLGLDQHQPCPPDDRAQDGDVRALVPGRGRRRRGLGVELHAEPAAGRPDRARGRGLSRAGGEPAEPGAGRR